MERIDTSEETMFQFLAQLRRVMLTILGLGSTALQLFLKMIFRCNHEDAIIARDDKRVYLQCDCGWNSEGWDL